MEIQETNKQEFVHQGMDLRKVVEIFLKKRAFIFGITLASALVGLILGFILPKVYNVGTTIGLGSFFVSSGQVMIETATQLKERINKDVYGQQVRDKLGISRQDYPMIKVNEVKDTNLLSLSIESSRPEQAKQILGEINNLILSDHQSMFDPIKKDLQAGVEIAKKDIAIMQSKVDFIDKEKTIIENKINLMQQVPIGSRGIEIQFAILDAQEKIEQKKKEANELLVAINGKEKEINSIQIGIDQGSATKVIKSPEVPEFPVRPRPVIYTIFGLVIGFFMGTFLLFGVDWWKKSK